MQYKQQLLQNVIDKPENTDNRATIDALKDLGITVYLAEPDSVDISILSKVVEHASSSSYFDRATGRMEGEHQKCLLYRDERGRLYNLVLANGCSGLAETWKSLLISFSGLQALVALSVLTRAFSCLDEESSVRPGYLSLLLGLILYEEMSQVWVNTSMFVRGTPSIAAYTLVSNFDSDWPRKIAVLSLALAAAQPEGSAAQRYTTVGGIAFAMMILAANLGARGWYFMKWRALGQANRGRLSSFFAPITSFAVAIVTGLVFPYMGFSKIQSGGKSAVQLVVWNSFLVALLFVISDLNSVQSFIVVGSDTCNQDNTNICMGIWFAMTSITCIFAAQKIRPPSSSPSNGEDEEDKDPILVEDHSSPVGYKVPNFPDFPIDPIYYGGKGLSCCSLRAEIMFGLVVGIGVGAFVVSTGLYDYLEDFHDYVAESV